MKKFKKVTKGIKEKLDISSLVFWGEDGKNLLISSSWDTTVTLFDDSDPESREGEVRFELREKHDGPVNHVDFLSHPTMPMTASASDDGTVLLYNHASNREEARLVPYD